MNLCAATRVIILMATGSILMPVCKSVHYWGRVQGVGFRATVAGIAQHYAVTGSVRNLPDGQVEVRVRGEATEIERFLATIASCLAGFIHGHRIDDEPEQTFSGFSISDAS